MAKKTLKRRYPRVAVNDASHAECASGFVVIQFRECEKKHLPLLLHGANVHTSFCAMHSVHVPLPESESHRLCRRRQFAHGFVDRRSNARFVFFFFFLLFFMAAGLTGSELVRSAAGRCCCCSGADHSGEKAPCGIRRRSPKACIIAADSSTLASM